ncbi:uncharacterized protein LOC118490096 [Helianthus annuus]|uniref:uncharacterized protein LOC118490096 n=1 Tax=Helianthus annuus TaxID=4232 RepID=UPI001653238B|nr:uncharacterized protein LOC118490096 [Helianthus annuus]
MSTLATTSNPQKEAGVVSLQCPILTATNYTTWAIKMEAILDAQGLWESIETEDGVAIDEKKSKLARAFLFQAIPEEVLLQVSKKKSAKEVWESLKLRYLGAERVQKARLHTLRSEFEAMRMKDGESIDEYAGKLSGMISKYSSLGETLEDKVVVRKFLDTVPDKYLQLVASIEQYSDLDTMPFDEAIGRLKAYEDRLKLRQANATSDNALLLTKNDGRFEQKSSHRSFTPSGRGRGFSTERGGRSGSRGRGASRGRGGRGGSGPRYDRKAKDKRHVKCFKCNNYGHYANECDQGKKEDDEVNLTQGQEEEQTLLLSVYGEETPSMVLLNEEKVYPSRLETNADHNVWYMDNGASNHMTGHIDMFAELDQKVTGQVRFGDGSKVQIEGKGTILFLCKNGDHLSVSNVYYIPALRSNVMSLGQMTEDGYKIIMKQEYLRMFNESGKLYNPTKSNLRFMWVYFLKTKDEAFSNFKKFKVKAEKNNKYKVGMLRTDRGGEFTSKEFNQYCEDQGIERQLTAPYTPQQNGVVERRNRTVMEVTRSLLKTMAVPEMFWGEAVRHAMYVLNRVSTKGFKGKTPYEGWKGFKPKLNKLKVFGCVGFIKKVGGHLDKLADRSQPLVYFGSESGSKEYRMYNPKQKRICVVREGDAEFLEGRHWAWNEAQIYQPTSQQPNWVNLKVNYEQGPSQGDVFNDATDNPNSQFSNVVSPIFDSLENNGDQGSSSWASASSSNKHTHNTTDSVASSTYDDTPFQGFRSLDDVYDSTVQIEDSGELFLIDDEPASYKEAVAISEWKTAMKSEIESIERNKTWSLVQLPAGHKAIGLKWVFKLKKDMDGNITKHKTRLVVKGYAQRKGVDFGDVFAPVARMETIRLLLAMAASGGWLVHHLDVKTAFLNRSSVKKYM